MAMLEHALLGLDYVDLMLIHWPVSTNRCFLNNLPDRPELRCASDESMTWSLEKSLQTQWEALEDFYRAGKARAIGVSSFCGQVLDAILQTATIPPMLNQILYHAGMGDD